MSDIPSFPYDILWGERKIVSIAEPHPKRRQRISLHLASKAKIRSTVKTYDLASANDALSDLRHGKLTGAAVLVP